MNKFGRDLEVGEVIYWDRKPVTIVGGFGAQANTIGRALFVKGKDGQVIRVDSMNLGLSDKV